MSPAAGRGSAGMNWVSMSHQSPTAKLIANALGVPLAYMYCDDEKIATWLLALHRLDKAEGRRQKAIRK